MGQYSKFITPVGNGSFKVNVPQDINNPSLEGSMEVTVTREEAFQLIGLMSQKKQYSSNDGTNERIVSEGDSDFDMNKWIKLAIGSIKQ